MEGRQEDQVVVRFPKQYIDGRVEAWQVSAGDDVWKEQPLCVVSVPSSSVGKWDKVTICAPTEGKFAPLVALEQQLHPGQDIAIIETCTHEEQYHQICCRCGKDLSLQHFTQSEVRAEVVAPIYSQPAITVTKRVAVREAEKAAEELRNMRKLSLVLDLDQTLVHATTDPNVELLFKDSNATYTQPHDPGMNHGREDPSHNLFRFTLDNRIYYLKLRPHLFHFLSEVKKLFDLHICTMGTQSYALKVSEVIDPQGILFRHKILSNDDRKKMSFKSLQKMFPCDDTMVIILDDRVDVWGNCKNLIRVEPYFFFHDTKVNALGGEHPNAQNIHTDENKRKRKGIPTQSKSSSSAPPPTTATDTPPHPSTPLTSNTTSTFTPTSTPPKTPQPQPPSSKRAKVKHPKNAHPTPTLAPTPSPVSSSLPIPTSTATSGIGEISTIGAPSSTNTSSTNNSTATGPATPSPTAIGNSAVTTDSGQTSSNSPGAPDPGSVYRHQALRDDQLLHILRFLRRVHHLFYSDPHPYPHPQQNQETSSHSRPRPDVKYCIYRARQDVFAHAHLAFTSVFPLSVLPHTLGFPSPLSSLCPPLPLSFDLVSFSVSPCVGLVGSFLGSFHCPSPLPKWARSLG
jgi:FCP1-like phosphatase family protein